MNDKGQVAEEGLAILVRRCVGINIVHVKGVTGDLAVLATQVTDLARSRAGGIAWDFGAGAEGVQVRQGGGAVAVNSRSLVDVVACNYGQKRVLSCFETLSRVWVKERD